MIPLIDNAENWQKSKLIREFILAVESKLATGECNYHPGCNWDEWFKWAKYQADRLDPLTLSPPSIVDKDKNNKEKESNSDINFLFDLR